MCIIGLYFICASEGKNISQSNRRDSRLHDQIPADGVNVLQLLLTSDYGLPAGIRSSDCYVTVM